MIRLGPSKLISIELSSGLSKLTVAAEWITTSHDVNRARSCSVSPKSSFVTSPDTTETLRSQVSTKSSPHCDRSASKASLRKISRSTRRSALFRRVGRTRRTSSQSGTPRSSRSTKAVPRKPVLPVMAIRLPERDSLITPIVLAENLPNGKSMFDFDLECVCARWYPRPHP